MKNSIPAWATQLAGVAVVSGIVASALLWRPTANAVDSLPSQEALEAVASNPKGALPQLRKEIESAKVESNVKKSDVVAAKAMRSAHAMAKAKDFGTARQAFLLVDKGYSGSGALNPDYGSVPDQARYQAIVCLVAEGKKSEAQKEFREFLKSRPTSHMAVQAFRRLVRLNGGVEDPKDIELYEKALHQQEVATKSAIAACGPKVVQRYLSEFRGKYTPFADIQAACRQTEEGTTMLDMVRALTQYKVGGEGMQLNAPDFRRQPIPFIWLMDDHFVLVEKRNHTTLHAWDPMLNGPRDVKLPTETDSTFQASVIIFH